MSPTEGNLVLSPSSYKESLEWDRVQSLRNYINMKFQKGEFKDADFETIKPEPQTEDKQKESSVSYPSADVIKTRIKSLSTNTTLNWFEKDTSAKYPKFGRLAQYSYYTSQKVDNIQEESKSNTKDNTNVNDATLSPPLARQLFAKHDLFDSEEIIIQNGQIKDNHTEWFPYENSNENNDKTPVLKAIIEDPNSSVNSSYSNIVQKQPQNISDGFNSWANVILPSDQNLNLKQNKENKNLSDPNTVVFKIKLTGDQLKDVSNECQDKNIELSIELNKCDKNSFLTNQYVEEISHKLLSGIKDQLKQIAPHDEYRTAKKIDNKKAAQSKDKRKLSKHKSMQFNFKNKISKHKHIDRNKISLISSRSIINSARSNSEMNSKDYCNSELSYANPKNSRKHLKISDSLKAKLGANKDSSRCMKSKNNRQSLNRRKPFVELKGNQNNKQKSKEKHLFSCRQIKTKNKHKKPKNYRVSEKENDPCMENQKTIRTEPNEDVWVKLDREYRTRIDLHKDSAEVSQNSGSTYDHILSGVPVLEVPTFVSNLRSTKHDTSKRLSSDSDWYLKSKSLSLLHNIESKGSN